MEDGESKADKLATGEPLRGFWYAAILSSQLQRGGMRWQKLLDEPLVLFRDKTGEVFALDDQCRHRGMPLSAISMVSASNVAITVGSLIWRGDAGTFRRCCPTHRSKPSAFA